MTEFQQCQGNFGTLSQLAPNLADFHAHFTSNMSTRTMQQYGHSMSEQNATIASMHRVKTESGTNWLLQRKVSCGLETSPPNRAEPSAFAISTQSPYYTESSTGIIAGWNDQMQGEPVMVDPEQPLGQDFALANMNYIDAPKVEGGEELGTDFHLPWERNGLHANRVLVHSSPFETDISTPSPRSFYGGTPRNRVSTSYETPAEQYSPNEDWLGNNLSWGQQYQQHPQQHQCLPYIIPTRASDLDSQLSGMPLHFPDTVPRPRYDDFGISMGSAGQYPGGIVQNSTPGVFATTVTNGPEGSGYYPGGIVQSSAPSVYATPVTAAAVRNAVQDHNPSSIVHNADAFEWDHDSNPGTATPFSETAYRRNLFSQQSNNGLPTYSNALPQQNIPASTGLASREQESVFLNLSERSSDAAQPVEPHRKKEDQILLDGKRAGWTYKEIKKRMGTQVAESTLRGRYRSLTKARKDRVRKPVWTSKDMRLLREIVTQELARVDMTCNRPTTESQRLAKLSWKRVSEYIAEHGSYQFGNSTCKKKWAEICGTH